ncbi:MAG: Crp/Fnr family transcriptional regulator [Pseudomonadota bacterium]
MRQSFEGPAIKFGDHGVRPILDRLDTETQDAIVKAGSERAHQAGAQILERGGKATVGVVMNGRVQLSISGPDGDEVKLSVLGPGHVFGELSALLGKATMYTISAVEACRVLIIPADKWSDLCNRYPDMALVLLKETSAKLFALLENFEDAKRFDLDERLVRYFVRWSLSQEADCDDEMSISVSQSDLAAMLGVSRATMARSLASLRRNELCETGYREMTIAPRRCLTQWLDQTRRPG